MALEKMMKCNICKCSLELAKVPFSYLGSKFDITALRCPECGNILVTEELAVGRIHATETFLEDRKMFQSN